MILLLLMGSSLLAQTSNPRAANWFKIGLEETNPNKKVEAYKKALEFEPLFVEALFNLGTAYAQLQEYELAKEAFEKSLTAKPHNTNVELRAQIHYQLSGADRRLGALNESEEHLRTVQKLKSDKSLQVKISLDLGRLLHEQGRYEKALAEFKRGQNIDNKSRSFFENWTGIVEDEMEIARLYSSALMAFQTADLTKAKTLFRQIQSQNPNFKDMAQKLAAIDSTLNTQDQQRKLAQLYQDAIDFAEDDKLEPAIATFEQLLQQAPDFRDAPEKLETVRRKYSQQKLQNELEEQYLKGVEALAEKNWTKAILVFENVLNLSPNYRDTKAKLDKANQALETESTENILSEYYSQAISAIEKDELGVALTALEKVRRIDPSYKQTNALIAKIESGLETKLDSTLTSHAVTSSNDVEALYKKAITAVQEEDWLQALLHLEKLKMYKPNDPDIAKLLSQTRANLKTASSRSVGETIFGESPVFLPLVGFMIFSPATRARLYLIRDKHRKAAQIYERLLVQHPDHVKFYVLLAKIYLLTGRKDEQARKIFQTLLNLNLAPKLHEEIRSVLTDRYLTESPSKTEAISVLEHALKNEQQKNENHRTH